MILIDRLLQTSMSLYDDLLITEPIYRRLSPAERHGLGFRVEQPDGFDPVPIWVRPLAACIPSARAAPADLVQ